MMQHLLSLSLAAYLTFLSAHVVVVNKNFSDAAETNMCRMFCDMSECRKDSPQTDRTKCLQAMEESCKPCTSCTCIIYCCCSVLPAHDFSFSPHKSSVTLEYANGKFLFSSYLSDCFHPPEMV